MKYSALVRRQLNPCVAYPIFVLLTVIFTVVLHFCFNYPELIYHSYRPTLFLVSELFLWPRRMLRISFNYLAGGLLWGKMYVI